MFLSSYLVARVVNPRRRLVSDRPLEKHHLLGGQVPIAANTNTEASVSRGGSELRGTRSCGDIYLSWRMMGVGSTHVSSQPNSARVRNTKPTFGRVPVDEGVHQRPAFAVVGGGQLQPISFHGADHLALPGHAHGERPLVVLTGQRVQRSAARSPGVEEDQQPQLSVSGRSTGRGAWRGAAAPLGTVHPAVGDPAHLLEDRADESNAPPGAAVHLSGRNNK
ncbi:hypothetical protein EYF80_027892 [Liparis tanakae]|uniref:Uncharacterized protein n=1 Tax=Liparis tanakae TaxID=230148 RepID=A0A4Z2H7W8_9TELE|nr:hypothetical protein EYF80_027892 [Liparis tanakae]